MGATFTYETLTDGVATLERKALVLSYRELALPDSLENVKLSANEEEYVAIVHDQIAIIPRLFAPFLDIPSASDLEPSQKALVDSANLIRTVQRSGNPGKLSEPANLALSAIESAGDSLLAWTGDAAREFKRDYLNPMPIRLTAQQEMVLLCAELVARERAIWEETANSVAEIVNRGIDAVDFLMSEMHKAVLPITLTVVAGIATIAAAATGPGASIALRLVLAGADAAAGIGGETVPEEEKLQMTLHAASASEVIVELNRAVTALITQIYEAEQTIAQVLYKAAGYIIENREIYVPKRPLLATTAGMSVADQRYLGING
ncbi:hypothetical protein KZ829_22315 [Actinoplanes hulinensis]|uniref:Uncharacterized protein n=1 Tax=Actinoplanes hulinensis TaxID=1144547 RepID=A0ABS7B616_9ACTN|nr:hypothetical protein [Actinoplanes hulinensis]MBW6436480.1 hypothetical protein [Actinoplanes hulinensis]